MKENILIEKAIDFGARIVKLYQFLIKSKHDYVLLNDKTVSKSPIYL